MKKTVFRNVAALVTVSLLAITVLQALWLGRMYSDMNEKFSRQVNTALERAAYDELISRSSPLKINASYASSSEIDEALAPVKLDSIRIESHYEGDSLKAISLSGQLAAEDSTAKEMVIDAMTEMANQWMEESRDSLIITLGNTDNKKNVIVVEMQSPGSVPSREHVEKCDSLLTLYLRQVDIDLPHRLSLASTGDGSEIYGFGQEVPGAIEFRLQADSKGLSVYKLQIANPNRRFLRELAGILISSVLIILLLGFSFSYLLRTLFRQKSLEKMRLDLTHNITHELKTPIAVATAAGEALSTFGAADDPGKRERYLKVIDQQLANLSAMVENILSMSLYEQSDYRLDFSMHSLREMLQTQVHALSLDGNEAVDLIVDVPEAMTVWCDRKHMEVVLKNLLDNAVKYSKLPAVVTVTARKENGGTVISIGDNGIGIPRQYMARIFDKFYRVPTGDRHDVKGFGLGLNYVRDMVEKHGGTVTVKSTPGKGSVFTIILPDHGK